MFGSSRVDQSTAATAARRNQLRSRAGRHGGLLDSHNTCPAAVEFSSLAEEIDNSKQYDL
jgi:hypothetical protein